MSIPAQSTEFCITEISTGHILFIFGYPFMDDKTYCAEIVPCSFDYLMISALCYLRISCYPRGEHDRVCYGGIGVLGELLLLLGKELTTPDMLLTNNWTWLGQHQVDKDYWALSTFYTWKI